MDRPSLVSTLQPVAPGLHSLAYPLRMAGLSLGRRVTVIELGDGRLVIHSTAPFTAEDVAAIHALGQPVALVEGTLFHDTHAAAGRAAFPDLPYFAPPTDAAWARGARPLTELPALVGEAIAVHPIEGIPAAREHVLIHRSSRTAIVCDLIFNLHPPLDPWTSFAFKFLNRCYARPGITRLFRSMIKDRPAFARSVESLLATHDFDRLVPAHGRVVESGAKDILRAELATLRA